MFRTITIALLFSKALFSTQGGTPRTFLHHQGEAVRQHMSGSSSDKNIFKKNIQIFMGKMVLFFLRNVSDALF
ncbi:hypothetical protein [Erwinia aphidicola]|uniref:hypothetical protein n=1 Tax=Erwinia aphidicola TaxID=68334 RepID=UPI0030CC8E18